MPSLEIAAAQPAFQIHLGTLRAQTAVYGNVISSPFAFGNDKKLSSAWKLSHISIKLNFNLGRINVPKGSLRIKAVATLESKSLVQNENAHAGYNGSQLGRESSPRAGQLEPSSDDSEDLDDREKLRRLRISNANKGSTPWNKGRKHSPDTETLKLIRERTRLAMQNPKVKMKLVNLGHAQSEKTRVKIGLGVRIRWQKRRVKLSLQEHCCYDWQNLIAEASRQGYDGEEELQWDIYKILDEKLTEEYIERVEQRKIMRRPKGSKRAPKSLEQRRKISQAISAKWNDPNYRNRVCSALAKYYDASYGPERMPTKKASGSTESTRRVPAKKKVSEKNSFSSGEIKIQKQRLRLRSKAPMYKDPLVSSKMEMIKNIRAQRAAPETGKTEAVERARLLIAEAEKAAMALEVAATKSPVARASLVETRLLIAEAIQFIESVEMAKISSFENEDPSVASNEGITQDEKEARTGVEELTEVDSGKQSDVRNEPNQVEPNGDGECSKNLQLNGTKVQSKEEETPCKPVTGANEKWIRGRLVEVGEEA